MQKKRLDSLDALRGFDMFFIIGGEAFIHTWATYSNWPPIVWMSSQLHHSDWNGLTFYDCIFPLFIFIAGFSMPLSFESQIQKLTQLSHPNPQSKILFHLLKRTLILISLGVVVNGFFKFQGYENTRIASVLGRIALACLGAGVLVLYTSVRTQIIAFVSILLGYFLLVRFYPVPDFGVFDFTKEGNVTAYFDRLFLPGKLHRKVYDPEGILSTIPAICNALMGAFTARFLLKNPLKLDSNRLLGAMILLGGGLIIMAELWDLIFPINKIVWTSSFVLITGGISIWFLTFFYWFVDVMGFKKVVQPFIWIGTNSITIYLAVHNIINFESTAHYFLDGMLQNTSIDAQNFGIATGVLFLQLAGLYFLYRNKLFLKI